MATGGLAAAIGSGVVGCSSPHATTPSRGNRGSVPLLDGGRVLVGCWGNQPEGSEFLPDGEPHTDMRFPDNVQSHRAFRSEWTGAPHD